MPTTEAWVLYQAPEDVKPDTLQSAVLKRESFSFPAPNDHEVLVEPIYGCWEGNMSHAIARTPIDVCRHRGEEKIVLGNAGVVRILHTGRAVTALRPSDYAVVFCNGLPDADGYPVWYSRCSP